MSKITVVGAGVCALSSALSLSRWFPTSNITIVSHEWHPNTTSNHGFGIIGLRCIDYLDDATNISNYVTETKNYCNSQTEEQACKMGIQLTNSVVITYEKTTIDKQNAQLFRSSGFQVESATREQVDKCGFKLGDLKQLFEEKKDFHDEHIAFYLGKYYVIDTGKYLPWIIENLKKLKHEDGTKRVHFEKKRLSCLSDVEPCDLIVNCSGLGAKDLVGDSFMIPIRGQYLSLHPCGLTHLLLLNHTFVVPRSSDVAVGSVYQVGRTDQQVDPDDTEDILRRAEVGFPAVRRAEIRKVDVGIRPGRMGGPRVELEVKKVSGDKVMPVIHNYGHGPRGIAQHYGCAMKVCRLASSILKARSLL